MNYINRITCMKVDQKSDIYLQHNTYWDSMQISSGIFIPEIGSKLKVELDKSTEITGKEIIKIELVTTLREGIRLVISSLPIPIRKNSRWLLFSLRLKISSQTSGMGTNSFYRQTKPELVGRIKFASCTQIINYKKVFCSQKLSEYQVSPESYNRTTYKRSLENAPILVKEWFYPKPFQVMGELQSIFLHSIKSFYTDS
jgi:hypothetical protein